VPDFGGASERERKLCIICSKGSLDMAYPGLILANAALGEGVRTDLFFTFWGFEIIQRSTMHRLAFTPAANPATHVPAMLAGLPGMQSMATRAMRRKIDELDVPPVPEMLETIKDAGGRLWACRMSLEMNGLELDDLYEGVDGVLNAAEFIDISEGAQTLFI
jgi:peroxiredoxin family protein